MVKRCLLGAALLSMILPGMAQAELKVGDKAPNFALKGTDGKTYKLEDMKDKYVVIAWYPKALTGG